MSDYPQMPPAQPQPAQSGLSDNAAGALAYVTIIPAIIFLIVEPYNRELLHPLPLVAKSIFLGIVFFAVQYYAQRRPDCRMDNHAVYRTLVLLVICWFMCSIKALNGERFKLPLIGDLAEKQANA